MKVLGQKNTVSLLIANVEYSKMSGSRMFEMYKKENEDFIKSLGLKEYHMCYSMKVYLDKVFEVN